MTVRLAVPTALTIAGSDPSGGAGLQADLKTFHQHGVYGMAAVTLLTVQNTRGVQQVEVMRGALVRAQLQALLDDVRVDALKTGALGSAEVIDAVASVHFDAPLVVDPVMISKHGHALLDAGAQSALISRLFPMATLLTPNAEEAAALLGRAVKTVDDAEEAARALVKLGPSAVLVKGGHIDAGGDAVDVLFDGEVVTRFTSPRVLSEHTHGTGCALSAAITAHLAQKMEMVEAIARAKAWLSKALHSPPNVGKGIGPPNHFAKI